MADKQESVFDKLDNQGEKIDDISQKLEGISTKDLYALAKRTWDYGDYKTAQKYYNHISLLRPLDWEAPLYASLCNFKGYHDMFFWTKVPEQIKPIIISTIKYIDSLSLNIEDKESEMTRCVAILEEYIKGMNDHYFKYTKEYNRVNSFYIIELEDWYLKLIFELKNVDLEAVNHICSFLADMCLYDLEKTHEIAPSIDSGKISFLQSIASEEKNIDFQEIAKVAEESCQQIAYSDNNISLEDKNKIMLKGKMFYEYSDRVIAKRRTKKLVIFGIIISICSLGCTIFSLLYSLLSLPFYIISFITGVLLIIKGFLDRKRIHCNSLLAFRRKKCRLTSDNSVVIENVISILGIYLLICTIAIFLCSVFVLIGLFTSYYKLDFTYIVLLAICIIINCGVHYLSLFSLISEGHAAGNYKFLYNGHFYSFK